MGYYKHLDADEESIAKYSSRIGSLITLLNYLEYNIQVFTEVLMEFDKSIPSNQIILQLLRKFEFSKRLIFLKDLVKKLHPEHFNDYLDIHRKIKEYSEIRNIYAHSQMYFWDNDEGTHMMISNLRSIDEDNLDTVFTQVTLSDLDRIVSNFRGTIEEFDSFTYKLGYFQG